MKLNLGNRHLSYQLPPLTWLRAFEASARSLSFTAAARELNLTPAAISHQVRSLEDYLGFPLFERLPRSLRLTSMANAYLPSVRKAFSELSISTSGLFGGGQQGLAVRCASSLSVFWLAPRMHLFLEQYPDIDLRLYSSNWAESLSAEKIDVDIRYGDGRWSDYRSELLMNEKVIPVCSQSLIDRDGPVREVADFAGQHLIQIMGVEDTWERLFLTHNVERPAQRRRILVDNSYLALEMACQGVGHALVFESFARSYLDEGKLVRSLGIALETEQSHYLLFPDDTPLHKPEVMVFRDWILAQAG